MKRKFKGLLLLTAIMLGSASILAQASEESSSEAVLASTQAAVQETTKAAAAVAAVPINEAATTAVTAEQPIVVQVNIVVYGEGYYGYTEHTIQPGGSVTVNAIYIEGATPEVEKLVITYEMAKTQTSYFIVYHVDSTTSEPTTTAATTETSTTTASPEPTTTAEPATTVASTTSEPTTTVDSPVTTTVEPATTVASTTAEPVTTTAVTPATTTMEPTITTTASSNQKVTISFDLAGGSLNGQTGTVSLEAELGQTITLPQAPTREGYRFLYWKGSVYQAGAQYTVTGPKTFTAVWEPISGQTTENKQKTLPSTGETSSTLSFLGLAGLGFLALLGWSRKRKA